MNSNSLVERWHLCLRKPKQEFFELRHSIAVHNWERALLCNQSKKNFIFSYWTSQGRSQAYLNFAFIPNLQMTLIWFTFLICIFKEKTQRWPRAYLKQYKTTREINQMAKIHKSGQACWTSYKGRHGHSVKRNRHLVPLAQESLDGGHLGEGVIIPP